MCLGITNHSDCLPQPQAELVSCMDDQKVPNVLACDKSGEGGCGVNGCPEKRKKSRDEKAAIEGEEEDDDAEKRVKITGQKGVRGQSHRGHESTAMEGKNCL